MVDLLNLLRGDQSTPGLRIIRVNTTDPAPITFIFEGAAIALDLELFEVPVSCYPLCKNDRLLCYPLVGTSAGQRYGVLVKINNGVTIATMQSSTSLKIEGINAVYGADRLLIPPYFSVAAANSRYTDNDTSVSYSDYYLLKDDIKPLQAGDVVSIAATWQDNKIKYVILERY